MYRVFGNSDRRADGTIKSEYPARYFREQRDELKKNISEKENALKYGMVPAEAIPRFTGELQRWKTRHDQIDSEDLKLVGPSKDAVSNMMKGMVERIRDVNWKRSELDKGFSDPHEEARRMSEPCIEIKSKEEGEFAEACNIKVRDGKVTKIDFERMYKIVAFDLGESTDIERLRRP